MPVSYTNRKGVTYTLYRGHTRTGKPRYYFGRPGLGQGEPVVELPPSFTISESVNGVVSLVKDHPSLIQPEEVEAVEAAVQQHPEAHRYRVAVKGNRIEVYEQIGPDYNELVSELHLPGLSRPGLAEEFRALEERHAHYIPVLRFTLLDSKQRRFGSERMSSLGGSTAGWNWGRRDPWQSWPVRSSPLWVPMRSLNSGEPATDSDVRKYIPEGPSPEGKQCWDAAALAQNSRLAKHSLGIVDCPATHYREDGPQ